MSDGSDNIMRGPWGRRPVAADDTARQAPAEDEAPETHDTPYGRITFHPVSDAFLAASHDDADDDRDGRG